MKATLAITGPTGQRYKILLLITQDTGSFTIKATYESGDLPIQQGTTIVNWTSYFELPYGQDSGFVDIGAGNRYIEVVDLRGIGLGSFFMGLTLEWVKSLPQLPVAPILLSMDDAKTHNARERRNRFWRKLGFELLLDETDSYGKSKPMLSNQLIQPELRLAKGWSIDEEE